MKCSKHAREMKWVGSLTQGGLVCEDCQFADESNAYKDEPQAIDPVCPQATYTGSVPPPPPASLVYPSITRAELLTKYVPTFKAHSINDFFYFSGELPEETCRRRAGFYHALLVNTDPNFSIRCPYCACIGTGTFHGCPPKCSSAYQEDQTNGLVIP